MATSPSIIPSFGRPEPGVIYYARPSAYGLCLREDGQLAIARVSDPALRLYDLPGGGIDGDETPALAMEREFLEETGLVVKAVGEVTRANQLWTNSNGARNSQSVFLEARLTGRVEAIREVDHELVWMSPVEALASLRHEAHAWAVTAWIRRQR
jgi:8-oxo-dGTP diphosphatase